MRKDAVSMQRLKCKERCFVYLFVQFPHSGAFIRADVLGINAVCNAMWYEWITHNENRLRNGIRFVNTSQKITEAPKRGRKLIEREEK